MDEILQKKYDKLQHILRAMGSVAVAFSSGVDSTLLLKVAHDVLGDKAVAITAVSSTFPKWERQEAEAFCQQEGIRQIICQSQELDIAGFRHNPPNRCYLCKRELFGRIIELAKAEGVAYVAEGSNIDDNGDYRPGMRAIAELKVASPLRQAGLWKQEIRDISKALGLSTWNKPSFACLSSRFVYGEVITEEKLAMVEKAEQLLLAKGFYQVRVRIHGLLARIEVQPQELQRVLACREELVSELKSYGFQYVTLDLQGYRTGSMNEAIGR